MGVKLGRQMDFPEKFRMDPGWVVWNNFWSENVTVRCSCDQMDFWSGGQENDVARSNGLVRGQQMCGLETWWACQTRECSGISKQG